MIIRGYDLADRPAALALLQQYTNRPAGELQQLIAQGQHLVAEQSSELVGFASLKPGRPRCFYLTLLVAPAARRQGIGNALWQQLQATLPADTCQVGCFCDSLDTASQAYLQRRGWEYWYGLELMHYSGPALPEPSLTVRPYRDGDYDDWIRLMNEGFHPMRQAMDIKPYLLYPDDVTSDPATRQQVLNSGDDDDLLFYDGDQLVGLAVIVKDEIETITVAKEHRRRGYARRILAYCTNRMQARGITPVTLHVVSWNADARQLYQGMGFRGVSKQQAMRVTFGRQLG